MGLLAFLEKQDERPTVEISPAMTSATMGELRMAPTEGQLLTKGAEPSQADLTEDDDKPVQDALDAILDTWIVLFKRRPFIYAGLVAAKHFVDVSAPIVRSALAAVGLRIVRISR